MNDEIAAGITGALDWVVGELGALMDEELDASIPEPPPPPIDVVPSKHATPWSEYRMHQHGESSSGGASAPKFKCDVGINGKIFTIDCDPLSLETGCLVVFLDELCKYSSKMANRIRRYFGNDGIFDRIESLRCGESCIVRSYNVGCQYIAYAVAPRHSPKYPEASSNILNMCIRESLKGTIEAGIDSIAFPMTAESDSTYPRGDFANTLLRTLRRWLELPAVNSKVQRIILLGEMAEFYPLVRRYFPRNGIEEALSCDVVVVGNEYGEIVCKERNIRVTQGPTAALKSDENGQDGGEFNLKMTRPGSGLGGALANFASARVSATSESQYVGSDGWESESYLYYLKLCYSMKRLDLYREMEESKFVFKCGYDDANRPVLLFDAQAFEFSNSHNYALAYTLGICGSFMQQKFVMVLANLDASFLKSAALVVLFRDLFNIVSQEQCNNVGAVYLLRCGWALRSFVYVVGPALPDAVWQALVFVSSVRRRKMVVYGLYLRAQLENCSRVLVPEDHVWLLDLKESDGYEERLGVGIVATDFVDTGNSRQQVNAFINFKDSKRRATIAVKLGANRSFGDADGQAYTLLASFDCRGIDIIAWHPGQGYSVECSNGHVISGVDLQQRDWAGFDEDCGNPVSVLGLEYKIDIVK